MPGLGLAACCLRQRRKLPRACVPALHPGPLAARPTAVPCAPVYLVPTAGLLAVILMQVVQLPSGAALVCWSSTSTAKSLSPPSTAGQAVASRHKCGAQGPAAAATAGRNRV